LGGPRSKKTCKAEKEHGARKWLKSAVQKEEKKMITGWDRGGKSDLRWGTQKQKPGKGAVEMGVKQKGGSGGAPSIKQVKKKGERVDEHGFLGSLKELF